MTFFIYLINIFFYLFFYLKIEIIIPNNVQYYLEKYIFTGAIVMARELNGLLIQGIYQSCSVLRKSNNLVNA